uniref:Akirin-2 n=1 Tax=Sinocyclocheilus grahami TaxID=75366 RepID=A0A672NS08_SINGR
MACGATLKRTMDFDPLLSPASPKRRRCAPMSPSPSPQNQPRPPKTARSNTPHISTSLCGNISITPPKCARKERRRNFYSRCSIVAVKTLCFSKYGEGRNISVTRASSGSASPSRREQPLFTLKQVGMICERLLKEREEKVREEYDQILTTKLAEQYDAFVKFTHDQLMRRFGEQPAKFFVSLLFPADQWCLSVLVSHECCCSADVS